MRNVRLSLLAAAVLAVFSQSVVIDEANAQTRSVQASQVQGNEKRYVSRTVRRVATPTRNARIYTAPRGAVALRSRNWDSRTRWIVDRRTNTSYAVLNNGEVWFMDPSSGWGYTVDRYGRVYGADPRRNTIYAFSSLNSWRGDLFYFFNYYTPWDGHYTLRDYDYFYSSYYGRRYDYYDAGYAYRTLWDDCDDYFFSRRFNSTVNFHYYDSRYLRYDRGWRSDYYLSYLPSVYVAPIYRYQVVNNVVVVNNNYYGSAGANGRGLPSARDAAVELSRDISVPVGFASNTISRQEVQALSFSSDVQIPVEPVKVIDSQTFASTATEAAIEIPGLDNTPVALTQVEQTQTLQQMDTIQPPNMEVAAVPEDFGVSPVGNESQPVAAPSDPGSFAEVPTEIPVDTARAEPVFEEQKEPAYQEPVLSQENMAQEPVQAMQEQPAYQEPAQEPVFEEPAYQEPISEARQDVDPVYQQEEQVFEDQKEPAYEQEQPVYQQQEEQVMQREEPVYQQQEEQSFQQEEPVYQQQEEPVYQQQEEQSYQREEPVHQQQEEQSFQQEEPVYQQQEEPSYQREEPVYQQQEEPSYQREEPVYQQEERYEAPQQQERYEAPQQQEERYEAPQQQERYEAPAEQSNDRGRDDGGEPPQ